MWEIHVEFQKHNLRLEILRGNTIFKLMGHTEVKNSSGKVIQSKIISIFLFSYYCIVFSIAFNKKYMENFPRTSHKDAWENSNINV